MQKNGFPYFSSRLLGIAVIFAMLVPLHPQELFASEFTCAEGEEIKIVPSQRGIYAGVYADGVDIAAMPVTAKVYGENLDKFTALAGKKHASAVIFNPWFGGKISFPKEQVKAVWAKGLVPRVFMAPMSSWDSVDKPDAVFPMRKFITGAFDKDLIRYAREVKETGIPMLLTFAGEVNAGWSWSAEHNGGYEADAYGDPRWPDGPERYRDACRHVIELFRREGVNNVTWGFHATVPWPGEDPGNAIHHYYPGDEYIDWIGISVYGVYAAYEAVVPYRSFGEIMADGYPVVTQLSPNKPLALFELGLTDKPSRPERKAKWITDALTELAEGRRWPRVHAFYWWHEYADGKDVSTAIDSSSQSLKAYQEAIQHPQFLEKVEFECVPAKQARK